MRGSFASLKDDNENEQRQEQEQVQRQVQGQGQVQLQPKGCVFILISLICNSEVAYVGSY
jgi:hypothetical protein